MQQIRGYMAALLVFTATTLAAQKVLYSDYISDRFADKFEIAGKTGSYYWLQKSKKKNQVDLPATPWKSDRQPLFEIYDERLNAITTFSSPAITENTLKEYFVCSDKYFDQLLLSGKTGKTYFSLYRYTADGHPVHENKIIDSLPFVESGNSFLLLRSEDKSKLLLLCFESIPDARPRLHSFLFDHNWQLLSLNKYEHRYISQPILQYDFFNYPLEHFGSSAVKLADNGEWMMVASSGRNHNFSLFHFNGTDTSFVYKEIKLPSSSSVEEVALSLDNRKAEVIAGILSKFRYSTLKNAQINRYSLTAKQITFDSSYRFNTLAAKKIKNENLYEESFVAVPGAGFMLLKEYGKEFSGLYQQDDVIYNANTSKDILSANNIAGNDEQAEMRRDEYTRFKTLGGPRSSYSRGDLSLFYFPAGKEDSCWSGIINKEQVTELNSSYLSYLVVPVADKLFFLYNSYLRSNNQYATTTILNFRGEEQDDGGIVYSRINNSLQFQRARQIAENEIAVPYKNSERNGFAIIKF